MYAGRGKLPGTCVLHNMLQESSTPAELTVLLESHDVNVVHGLQDLPAQGYRGTDEALRIREKFKRYFIEINPLTWQNAHVRRGLFQET